MWEPRNTEEYEICSSSSSSSISNICGNILVLEILLQSECYLEYWLLKYRAPSDPKLRTNDKELNWKTTIAKEH